MTPLEASPKLYSVADVVRLTGVSRATVTARFRQYEIGQKVGRDIVFTEAEVAVMRSWPYRPGRPRASVESRGSSQS